MSQQRYAEHAARGEALSLLRIATLNGTLWATALAWSTAVREIVVTVLPDNLTSLRVLAELVAIVITTALGVVVAIAITRPCRAPTPPPLSLRALPYRRRAVSAATIAAPPSSSAKR